MQDKKYLFCYLYKKILFFCARYGTVYIGFILIIKEDNRERGFIMKKEYFIYNILLNLHKIL